MRAIRLENSLRKILLACLHRAESRLDPAALSTLTGEEWATLIDMATRHGVASLLYQRLKAPTLVGRAPDGVLERLRGLYLNTAACNVRLYEELRALLLALGAAGIPILVLKGAYLAANVYRNIALRPMGDIDILVPKTAARDALKILKNTGYELHLPATEEAIPFFGKDMVLKKEGCHFPVEVHWTLTDHEIIINMDELWKRHQSTSIEGVEGAILSFEDFLLHICLHASYHHEFNISLMALYDITFFIEQFQKELSWDRFCHHISIHECSKGIYLILYLAKELAGANVPSKILEILKPTSLSKAMITAAKYRILHGQDSAAAYSINLISLWTSGSSIEQFRIIWRRLFPSRQEMSYMYPIPPGSLILYGYYLVRMKDLMRRHGAAAWRLWRGNGELAETVRQRDALREWLFKADAR